MRFGLVSLAAGLGLYVAAAVSHLQVEPRQVRARRSAEASLHMNTTVKEQPPVKPEEPKPAPEPPTTPLVIVEPPPRPEPPPQPKNLGFRFGTYGRVIAGSMVCVQNGPMSKLYSRTLAPLSAM